MGRKNRSFCLEKEWHSVIGIHYTQQVNTYRYNGEHHLGDIEGVPPVVVDDVAVVLLHTEKPPTQHFVVYVEPLDKVQVQEHPQASLPTNVINSSQLLFWRCKWIKKYQGWTRPKDQDIHNKNKIGREIPKKGNFGREGFLVLILEGRVIPRNF